MIPKPARLSNDGSNPANVDTFKKLAKKNLKTIFDGRNMKLDMIKEVDIRLVSKVIGYKMSYSSSLNSVPTIFIHATYMIIAKKEKVNICEVLK